MALKEKVWKTLSDYFSPEELVLDDEYGITGFIVSPRFRKMDVLDRMDLMDTALDTGKFTPSERRKMLMIAPLTPAEYSVVGPEKPKRKTVRVKTM